MRELNIEDILKQEEQVKIATRQGFGGFCDYYNQAIDLLIKLYYRIPTIPDVKTPEGDYLSHVSYWFYMSIFTFRSCFLLFEKGYYLEANILCRNLIEVYIKMRYFRNHKDRLSTFEQPHIKGVSTTFKTMFNEILPDFYDVEYRWMLSHVSHGGVGARIFKIDHLASNSRRADAGVFFKSKWASLVMNNLNVYIFGYIRFYKQVFSEEIKQMDPGTFIELQRIEKILQTSFEQHIALKGVENSWHKAVRPIWDF